MGQRIIGSHEIRCRVNVVICQGPQYNISGISTQYDQLQQHKERNIELFHDQAYNQTQNMPSIRSSSTVNYPELNLFPFRWIPSHIWLQQYVLEVVYSIFHWIGIYCRDFRVYLDRQHVIYSQSGQNVLNSQNSFASKLICRQQQR